MQQYPDQPPQQPQTFPSNPEWNAGAAYQPVPQHPYPLPMPSNPEWHSGAMYQPAPQQPYPQSMPSYQQPPISPAPYPAHMQTPKKSPIWPWIVAIVVVFFFGFGAGRASIGATTASTSPTQLATPTVENRATPTPIATPTPTTPVNKHFKVGETAKVGDSWEVTVLNVKTVESDDFSKPGPGNIFLIIEVTMKNTSQETQPASSLLQFTLRDLEGQGYDHAFLSSTSASPGGKIEPGAQTKGPVPFEVPANKKAFTLSVIGLLADDTVTIWDINL